MVSGFSFNADRNKTLTKCNITIIRCNLKLGKNINIRVSTSELFYYKYVEDLVRKRDTVTSLIFIYNRPNRFGISIITA